NNLDFDRLMIQLGDSLFSSPSAAIQKIRSAGKQEERLALLLQMILNNRNFSSQLVGLYRRDSAKFANLVIKDMAKALKTEGPRATLFGEEIVRLSELELAHLLFSRFRRGMQMNRVLLLYYMAKHLSQFPAINEYLRARLDRSWSMYLTPYRKEI